MVEFEERKAAHEKKVRQLLTIATIGVWALFTLRLVIIIIDHH